MDGTAKRGRGRGRGTRARGRGRGRGKKVAVVVSDEDASQSFDSVVGIGAAANNVALMEDADVLSTSGASLAMAAASSATEAGEEVAMHEANKENDVLPEIALNALSAAEMQQNIAASTSNMQLTSQSAAVLAVDDQSAVVLPVILPQTIDMEADISQLEAPIFTTISRGPPEPMLRLKWDHKVNLIGEKVLNPMIHCCDQCDKPILLYGRMIPCKHVFCLKCARTEPVKACPRCNDKVVRVEQSGLGTVFMCTHGGSRYGNTGCRRTYLSQRDLQAHINHRHITQLQLVTLSTLQQAATNANDIKQDIASMEAMKSIIAQRKLSESSAAAVAATTAIQAPSTLLLAQRSSQMRAAGIGNIPTPGSTNSTTSQSGLHVTHSSLTLANLARINTANAQDCHQGKVALHQTLKKTPITQSHHQTPETVADASYYSSVLNSFGSSGVSSGAGSSNAANAGGNSNANNPANSAAAAAQNQWQQNQYYR